MTDPKIIPPALLFAFRRIWGERRLDALLDSFSHDGTTLSELVEQAALSAFRQQHRGPAAEIVRHAMILFQRQRMEDFEKIWTLEQAQDADAGFVSKLSVSCESGKTLTMVSVFTDESRLDQVLNGVPKVPEMDTVGRTPDVHSSHTPS